MDREDEIRQMAYCLWEQEGCCGGHDLEYWLKAEFTWEERHKPAATAAETEKPAEKSAQKIPVAAAKKSSRNRRAR